MPVPSAGLLIAGAVVLLAWMERRRPLRRRVEPGLRRVIRNVAVAAISVAGIQALERPITRRATALAEERRWGLVGRLSRPWLRTILALLLMDYTLYVWHVLTHRMPQLWRLHIVHHVDLDLDVSTALRFHIVEMLISTVWRVGQILLIGISPQLLLTWQRLTVLSVMFHHSNLRLPLELERWLQLVIVTPRMHGIHHSVIQDETDSNWSSGLTIWDWLHGTLRLDVSQEAISIGVPNYRSYDEVRLPRLLILPFTEQDKPDLPQPTSLQAPAATME